MIAKYCDAIFIGKVQKIRQWIRDTLQKKKRKRKKTMDKSWIDLPTRMLREYLNGIDRFLEFVYTDRLEGSFISCLCRIGENRYNFS